MKKIQKSKKGFTLVEIVLIIGITKYLNGANAAKKSISEHQSAVEKVVDDVNGQVPGVFV